MNNVKFILSYDGTDFNGYQSQKNQRTVEDTLKNTITKILKKKVILYCAGRTDSGVHAEMQIVNFFTEQKNMTPFNWIMAANSLLPHDIRVVDCEFVSPDFNARRSAKKREYWYYLLNSPFISALDYRYAAHYPHPLDLQLLKQYAAILVGQHDFSSFCSSKDNNQSKWREIFSFNIEKEKNFILFKIIGNSFLHHMVRIIIGTLLHLHKKSAPAEDLKKIIAQKHRHWAGPTFYACGLVLKKVYY